MKKKYIKPYLEIIAGVLNTSILDGSTSGGGGGAPGEEPVTPIQPGGTIVDSKKNFNAWENWDEY